MLAIVITVTMILPFLLNFSLDLSMRKLWAPTTLGWSLGRSWLEPSSCDLFHLSGKLMGERDVCTDVCLGCANSLGRGRGVGKLLLHQGLDDAAHPHAHP